MLQHVYERAAAAPGLSRVVVLTDDERVAEAVATFGGEVQMTPVDCASGTDRIAYAAQSWSAQAVVNIQGDEPLIEPAAIGRVATHLAQHPGDGMVTLAAPAATADAADANVVKVVIDATGRALYFSRAAIPHRRDHPTPDGDSTSGTAPIARRHIGIYGYQRDVLLRLAALPPTVLERLESLEQLRALENGIPIRVLDIENGWPGVDTMDDLEAVESLLSGSRPVQSPGAVDRAPAAGRETTRQPTQPGPQDT